MDHLPPCSEITIKNRPLRHSVAGGVIGLVILLLLGTPAEGRWRVDIEGGASIPTTDIEIAGEKFTPNAGPSFAIGGGYELTEYLELNAQFQNSVAIDLFDESLDVYSVTAGPRLYLLRTGRVHPWLIGQIGWYRASGSVSDFCVLFCDGDDGQRSRDDDTFGLNVGGGVDVAVTDLVSLGLDLRYHNAFDTLGGLQFVTTMLNVGFHFGGQD